MRLHPVVIIGVAHRLQLRGQSRSWHLFETPHRVPFSVRRLFEVTNTIAQPFNEFLTRVKGNSVPFVLSWCETKTQHCNTNGFLAMKVRITRGRNGLRLWYLLENAWNLQRFTPWQPGIFPHM